MPALRYFLIPFILSLSLTPLVRWIAIKNGLIAYPRKDRWHKRPTALLGGAGIFLAALLSVFILGVSSKPVLKLLAGGAFLFVIGLADEKLRISPYAKLFAQIIAGCIVILFGFTLQSPANIFLCIPLTLLWIIAITNSFNLLDNIDGLSAGIAAICSLMLFFSSQIFSNNPLGNFALILAGAALGFLPYNFNSAKIFMGDSGSMFLGFSLAVISITGTSRHITNFFVTMFVPVLILSVPIFDTIFVMIIRKIQGRKIFQGGKDHTSHHLVVLGLSQKKTVLLLYSISIVFGLIGISYSTLNFFVISIISILAVVILVFFGMFLFDGTSYKSKPLGDTINPLLLKNNNNTALNAFFFHKRRLMETFLDFIFICVAYYSAYFLRFEGTNFSNNVFLVKQSLPWVIVFKMLVFFLFGLYRGVWRYISVSDFLTIFKVVSISSISSILFLTFAFRFQDYSRAVFFIDWLLLLFLVTGSRFLFRIIGEFFSRLQSSDGKKVLIFGAGDTGEMVLREIKRNKTLSYNPVGFVDDDPLKLGSKIHGVKVIGSRQDIKDLIQHNGIEEIIIAIPSFDLEALFSLDQFCRESGVTYKKIKGILDD